MQRGVLSLILVVVVCPSCASPRSTPRSSPFAPSQVYAKRESSVSQFLPSKPTPTLPSHWSKRPLTGRTPMRTWYPRGGKISNRWTTIVIHHSATASGSARTFDKYHRETKHWDALGYHFVIGNGTESPDGQVEVGVRWDQQKHGAHCKTPSNYFNNHGIGICLVGDFTKSRPTPKQLRALNDLVAFLSQACSIPPSRVTTHGHINRTTKCPGRYFALDPVRRHLAEGSKPLSSRGALVSQHGTRQVGAR